MEGEILIEALEIATDTKTSVALAVVARGKFPLTAVCETFALARSYIAERVKQVPSKAGGRPPLADHDLFDEIMAIISEMPTYGYRRVHAILRSKARSDNLSWPNAKRVYRVRHVHDLFLQRHTGAIDTRRHDGRVALLSRICVGARTV